MSDELGGKTPEAGPSQDTPVEGASQQGAVYDGPIEKFKGKTAAEIAQSYNELESTYGRTKSELSEVAGRAEAYERWYQQQQQAQQSQQGYQQPAQQDTPDIYENPAGAVQHFAQPIVQQEFQKYDIQRSFSEANQAKFMARQMYPAVFDGVDEKKLDQIMFSGAQANVQGQGGIHHTALRDPNAWRMAAWQMRGEELGYKAPGPGQMNVPQTEQPAGGRSEDGSSRMTDGAMQAKRLVINSGSLTEKEAQEVWEQTLKELEGKNG